jgi:hypothetical protein
MRVLLTNENLTEPGGASLYVRDVAFALQRRGHRPVVYSPQLGDVAQEIRSRTIPVVDRLDDLAEAPDVIHGQNHRTTMVALLHFPYTPAVNVCHGWLDTPVHFPRILRYVAVDEVVRDHLVSENGIPPEKVKLVLNFADLDRFKARGPLPETPANALIFSNGVAPGRGLEAIEEACRRAGLRLDAIGSGTGGASLHPEDELPKYDIVFAKARCAIEALAAGCAVVVVDTRGLAGMVTTENLEELRRQNFGWRSLARPLDPGYIFEAIRAYSAGDAAKVSRSMRKTADLQRAAGELIEVYEEAVREYRGTKPDLAGEHRAVAAYLSKWPVGPEVLDAHPPEREPARPSPVLGPASGNMLLTLVAVPSLHAFVPIAGRVVNRDSNEWPSDDEGEGPCQVMIATSSTAWHYAASLPLTNSLPGDIGARAGVVHVRFRVKGARVGLGILDAEGGDFLTRQAFAESAETLDMMIRLNRLDRAGHLLVQSWDQPEEALVEVDLVELYVSGGA